jgi:SnoaL-like domain
MTSAFNAKEFARDWVESWNAHDLDRILSHYAADVELSSPVVARVLGDGLRKVQGKDQLRIYFGKGLELFPELRFTLVDVLAGLASIVLYYENQRGTKTAEFMEFDGEDRVVRVVANYSL